MIRVAIQIEGMQGDGKTELAGELFDFFRARAEPVHVQIESSTNRMEGPHAHLWNFEGALTIEMTMTFTDTREG